MIRLGVDVGGTFTDLVQLDQNSGAVRLAKVASTLDNQAFGVLEAIDKVECELADVAMVIHGTTTTTNAVLERKLSKTALITTTGFRDSLELGRRMGCCFLPHFEFWTDCIPRRSVAISAGSVYSLTSAAFCGRSGRHRRPWSAHEACGSGRGT